MQSNLRKRTKHIHVYRTRNKCFLKNIQNVVLPLSHSVFHSQIHQACPVHHGLDNITVNVAKMMDYLKGLGGFFDLQFSFIFTLERQLRLNLSFAYIYIPNMYGNCHTNKLQIKQNNERVDFVYCGIQADFFLYPFSNQVQMTPSLKEALPLRFLFTSSILSQDILFNQELFPGAKVTPISIHNMVFCKTVIFSYRITTRKFRILVLNISVLAAHNLFVFDGPGVLSKMESVSINKQIPLRSYQCLIQIIKSVHRFLNHNIDYKGNMSVNTALSVDTSKSISIHYPDQICESHYCVVYVHSTKDSVLKVAMSKISFIGKQTRDCRFGGISVLDFMEEVFTFCENIIYRNIVDSHWHRITFIDFSSGFLLLHSYNEYSYLSCHINISAVNCQLVKLTTCGDYQTKAIGMEKLYDYFTHIQSLETNKCTVVQISSGLHDKNNMLDLEMSDAFVKYSRVIYPLCKPIELKLDQTRFNKKGVHYNVKSLIQKYDLTSVVTFGNLQEESKTFKGKITLSELCPGSGKLSVNSSLAISKIFGFSFAQWFQKAPCHIELFASYHIKTTMTVYNIEFPYLSSNWVVFVINASSISFMNGVQFNRINFPSFKRIKWELSKFYSIDTKNLALSDIGDKVLSVRTEILNHSNEAPLLLHFEAEENMQGLNFRNEFDNVPEIYHRIYPVHKWWKSYHYLLQENLNNRIVVALQGVFSSLKMSFIPFQNRSKTQAFCQDYKQVFYHWVNLKARPPSAPKFLNDIIGSISLFVAKKGKYSFSVPFQNVLGYKKGTISWVSAKSYCERTKSILPSFFSRDSLQEFLFLLKQSSEILTVMSMFIDLRVKFSQLR